LEKKGPTLDKHAMTIEKDGDMIARETRCGTFVRWVDEALISRLFLDFVLIGVAA
jgi:hypothetical protein